MYQVHTQKPTAPTGWELSRVSRAAPGCTAGYEPCLCKWRVLPPMRVGTRATGLASVGLIKVGGRAAPTERRDRAPVRLQGQIARFFTQGSGRLVGYRDQNNGGRHDETSARELVVGSLGGLYVLLDRLASPVGPLGMDEQAEGLMKRQLTDGGWVEGVSICRVPVAHTEYLLLGFHPIP